MDLLQSILMLLVGTVLLIVGGNIFVDSAVWLAEKTGIPKVIIGATVVSMATTMPEMIVSFVAATSGKVDIAIGNAVGSATVNIGMILAITILFLPIVIKRNEVLGKSLVMLAATAVIALFSLRGELGIVPNTILLILFVVFMAENIITAKKSAGTVMDSEPELKMASVGDGAAGSKKFAAVNIGKFIVGALFIMFGSQILVDHGSLLASGLGVSERVIAVTIIAIGTSLPELITALSAVVKKQSDLSVGNIIGANVINLTFVQPMCALLSGRALPVSANLARIDIPVCMLIGSIALIPMLVKQKFYKIQGVLLIGVYAVYVYITTTA